VGRDTESASTSLLADVHVSCEMEHGRPGRSSARGAGLVAVLLRAVLVFFLFPRHDEEERLLAAYHAEDAGQPDLAVPPAPGRRGVRTPGAPA
jgi:hypothetical protein